MAPHETPHEREWLAHQFEGNRSYLRAVAYRMLGSRSEAEDVVQEAWLRLDRSQSGAIDDLRRWLTMVVSRICLDHLRARRSQLEDYVGTWLPEPIVEREGAAADVTTDIADSVGLALLVILETLTPAERLAFVLHDVFAVSFEEIAGVVGRTPAAARQLASRARRRVRQAAPPADADRAAQRRVVDAFLAAARAGDFDALIAILDPDVVMRTDGGGTGPLARPPLRGAEAVARQVQATGSRFASIGVPVIVNGAVGVLVGAARRPVAVVNVTIARGRITSIDIIGDPAKLSHIDQS
jgi:RNA polymerase sigma factor (sigma-70 family)